MRQPRRPRWVIHMDRIQKVGNEYINLRRISLRKHPLSNPGIQSECKFDMDRFRDAVFGGLSSSVILRC
jgi:hypothetical protein